jgi:hypothetical protein
VVGGMGTTRIKISSTIFWILVGTDEPYTNDSVVSPLQAEPDGELDPQSVAFQSVGVLIGSPSLIAGRLSLSFCL